MWFPRLLELIVANLLWHPQLPRRLYKLLLHQQQGQQLSLTLRRITLLNGLNIIVSTTLFRISSTQPPLQQLLVKHLPKLSFQIALYITRYQGALYIEITSNPTSLC